MQSIHPLQHLITTITKPSSDDRGAFFTRVRPTPVSDLPGQSNRFHRLLSDQPFLHLRVKPY